MGKTDQLRLASCCYKKIKDYDSAIKIIKKIPDLVLNKGKDAQLLLADCYINIKDFSKAMTCIQKITDWKNDTDALLILGKCYEKMNLPEDVIRIYQSISGWEDNKKVLIRLGNYCIKKQSSINGSKTLDAENISASYSFEMLLKKFPDDSVVYYHYCKYLLKNAPSKALAEIDSVIKKYPKFPNHHLFYFLKAKGQALSGQHAEAIKTFKFITRQYPTFAKAQPEIDELMEINKSINKINSLVVRKVAMKGLVKDIFQSLNTAPKPIYLVGSHIHKLLNNNDGGEFNQNQKSDIDLVSPSENIDTLKKLGFHQNPYNNRLYNIEINDQIIDCYIEKFPRGQNLKQTVEEFIIATSKSRDYTINCLVCDKDGNIYDATGLGLNDLKHKILRMNGDPATRLREDPVRILRAIKLMTLGFHPTIDLQNAIKAWKKDENFNEGHIFSVIRKHLKSLDNIKYVYLLKQYNLLSSMFGIKPDDSDAMNLEQLKKVVNTPSPFPTRKINDIQVSGRSPNRHRFYAQRNQIKSSIATNDSPTPSNYNNTYRHKRN